MPQDPASHPFHLRYRRRLLSPCIELKLQGCRSGRGRIWRVVLLQAFLLSVGVAIVGLDVQSRSTAIWKMLGAGPALALQEMEGTVRPSPRRFDRLQ